MMSSIVVDVSADIRFFLLNRLKERARAVGMDVSSPDPFNISGMLDIDKLSCVLRALGSGVDLFDKDAPDSIVSALREVQMLSYEPGDITEVAAFSYRIARSGDQSASS
ncbi:MAG: hypothetical protein AAFV69_00250 [Pseudomonadota bacterium]